MKYNVYCIDFDDFKIHAVGNSFLAKVSRTKQLIACEGNMVKTGSRSASARIPASFNPSLWLAQPLLTQFVCND